MEAYKKLKKKWKLCIIHHTHTDVGYTDPQEVIEARQIDFIRQAIEISEAIRDGRKKEWKGFHWVCESFWEVEKFWEQASTEMKERFLKAVSSGDIEITGNYLNLNETIDEETLRHFLGKAQKFSKESGRAVSCAMTADINGYSWGYAQVLYDSGIRNFYTCIHTHHGMFPMFRKQMPFYWETPQGDKLLVWNGDHYMLGNDLGIVPGAVSSYMIRDEIDVLETGLFQTAEKRIFRYLEELEKEGYPFDFIPVNASGLLTDNAPPNGAIMDFVKAWNAKYSDVVLTEMSTLDHFFELVKNSGAEIQTCKGDWPDWWSEGQGASYEYTKVMRQAQRSLKLIKKLDPQQKIIGKEWMEKIYENIIMYAEHTFSYSSSMEEPWADMVKLISNQKYMYAVKANQMCNQALSRIKRKMGEVELCAEMPRSFMVVNPYDTAYTTVYNVYIENWEKDQLGNNFQIWDVQKKAKVPYQIQKVARGIEVSIEAALQPGEKRVFTILQRKEKEYVTIVNDYLIGADGVADIKKKEELLNVSCNSIETPTVRIEWKYPEGITGWYDKILQKELIRTDRKFAAFTPVYEITPLGQEENICTVRRKMGRNRKGENVVRYTGHLKKVKLINKGTLFTEAEFTYELEGTDYYVMILKIYHNISKVDVSVRMNKKSVWEPENLYISMPFGWENGKLWIEKLGTMLRPGLDQIPGTNIDFYCVQNGVGYLEDQKWLAIATPDAPLIQTGSLEYEARSLSERKELKQPMLYSWALNNFWETNFDASTGGFHQIKYSIQTGTTELSPDELRKKLEEMNTAAICMRGRYA